MNTYGHLSNVSLMQSYGFAEVDNPYDEVSVYTNRPTVHVFRSYHCIHIHAQALVSVDDLKKVFVGNSSMSGTRQERWAAVEGQVGHHHAILTAYLMFEVAFSLSYH